MPPRAANKSVPATPNKQNGNHEGQAEQEQPALLKTGFARQTKKFIGLMDQLRSCGITADADVPTIAILGNQSSGKSSVIEAISGIALPRATGTCTRCPTEVRLNRKNCEWTCRVSLRFDKKDDGSPNDKIEELPFGPDIHDSEAVTERLRRAQIALLLGQKTRFSATLTGKMESLPKPTVSFSDNTICITIWGPDCVDLSFIDLPGIIVFAGDGEQDSDVTTVESMARKAVTRENCLILLTITCTDDIQNQSGVTLAREVDPEGKRTIGVLTKADRIADGDHGAWLDILKGKSQPLQLGYYAVKNPNTKELEERISNAKAREAEAAFFETDPWNRVPKSKLGTTALANKLSTFLEQNINDKLPGLIETLRTKLHNANKGLESLPMAVGNGHAVRHISKLCSDLGKDVQDLLEEEHRRPEFYRSLRDEAFTPFVDQIQKSPPIFFEDAKQHKNVEDASLYAVRARAGYQKTICARDQVVPELFGEKQRLVCLVEDIRKRKLEATSFELPGNSPYPVKRQLIKDSIQHWPHLAKLCFDKCKHRLENLIKALLEEKFGEHRSGGLHAKVQHIARELLRQCEMQFEEELDKLIRLEGSFVYTNGNGSFMERKGFYIEQLRSKSPNCPNLNDLDKSQKETVQGVVDTLQKMSVPAFRQLKAETLMRAIPPSEYQQEIEICADVLAYFDVAGRRFIDSVPMAIVVHFIQAVGNQLENALIKELGVYEEDGTAKCSALLAEDPELRLEAKRDRLTRGLELAHSFGVF